MWNKKFAYLIPRLANHMVWLKEPSKFRYNKVIFLIMFVAFF